VIAAVAGAETAAVPVEAFQVDEARRELAMAGLPHTHDAVDAFHQAARSPATTQDAANRRHRLLTTTDEKGAFFVEGFVVSPLTIGGC